MAQAYGLHAHRRGTVEQPASRFEHLALEPDPDAAGAESDRPVLAVATQYFRDASRSVIARNDSPDIPFTCSLNPYRGCEHGCIYCCARPYHEYLGLSAGLDFETKIFVKEEAPRLLRDELRRPSWRGECLAMCGVTDAYQPIERRLGLTRRCLEVLADCRQPVALITKSALVARDADLLAELARHRAAHVSLTITTLDESLRRVLEPRAATADARLDAIARLTARGVPAGVLVSPVIPGLTDHEIPRIVERAASAGASFAAFMMLRLPHGVAALFDAWLSEHVPVQRGKILGRVRDVRGGCLDDLRYGDRMRGNGPLADLTARMFHAARVRAGLAEDAPRLSPAAFRRPSRIGPLFDGLV
jgi:DNA repair photolyase